MFTQALGRLGIHLSIGLAAFCLTAGLSDQAFAVDVRGKVSLIKGEAFLLTQSGKQEPLKADALIPPHATIRTTAGAQVVLEAFPGAKIKIMENARVKFDQLSLVKVDSQTVIRKARVSLQSGKLVSALRSPGQQQGASSLQIQTPKGELSTLDGVVDVEVSDGGEVRFASLLGNVKLTTPEGDSSLLPEGFQSDTAVAQVEQSEPSKISPVLRGKIISEVAGMALQELKHQESLSRSARPAVYSFNESEEASGQYSEQDISELVDAVTGDLNDSLYAETQQSPNPANINMPVVSPVY